MLRGLDLGAIDEVDDLLCVALHFQEGMLEHRNGIGATLRIHGDTQIAEVLQLCRPLVWMLQCWHTLGSDQEKSLEGQLISMQTERKMTGQQVERKKSTRKGG